MKTNFHIWISPETLDFRPEMQSLKLLGPQTPWRRQAALNFLRFLSLLVGLDGDEFNAVASQDRFLQVVGSGLGIKGSDLLPAYRPMVRLTQAIIASQAINSL